MFDSRVNQRSAIKHSQSGDVSQATQRPTGRRKLQRGQSEDVTYSTRPQVQKHTTENSRRLIHMLYPTNLIHTRVLLFLFSPRQELVELKQVENISDSEEYPSLEGHSRAASLPRLNAEYYVRPSGLLLPQLTERKNNISLFCCIWISCQMIFSVRVSWTVSPLCPTTRNMCFPHVHVCFRCILISHSLALSTG